MAQTIYCYEYWSKKKSKKRFWKNFFKLINNAVFGKTMENGRNDEDIKLVTKEWRRNYLVSEPNYHFTKFFTDILLAIKMKKNRDAYEEACLFRTFNTRIK